MKLYIYKKAEDDNAYTTLSHSNFYFDCSNEGLHGALDRFAQFFISPLFKKDCVDKEIISI